MVSLSRLTAVAAVLPLLGTPIGAQVRTMFVTSVTGMSNLSLWAEAGGQVGAAAGTEVCRARANAAGLPNHTSYVAWLSTSTTDAYCRVAGFSGKKSTNCGQASLPNAGPWVRVDGKPFARDLASLAAGATLNPPWIDENGATISSGAAQLTLTGTLGDGTVASTGGTPNTCTDWTYAGAGSPPSVRAGLVPLTLDAWTATGAFLCNSTGRLLCFESGAAVVSKLPSFEQEGALAFATATTAGGNLGAWPQAAGATGLAAGDAICRNSALAAAHPHPAGYVAWLSDLGVAHAIDRLVYDGSWKRLDGVEIATSRADLLAADSFVYALQSPLNVTEWGVYQDHQAITGTNTQGLATGTDCMGWTDGTNLQSADYGFPFDTRGAWTKQSSITVLCNAFYRLYCFGSVPILFWDSFEPGAASRWWAKYP